MYTLLLNGNSNEDLSEPKSFHWMWLWRLWWPPNSYLYLYFTSTLNLLDVKWVCVMCNMSDRTKIYNLEKIIYEYKNIQIYISRKWQIQKIYKYTECDFDFEDFARHEVSGVWVVRQKLNEDMNRPYRTREHWWIFPSKIDEYFLQKVMSISVKKWTKIWRPYRMNISFNLISGKTFKVAPEESMCKMQKDVIYTWNVNLASKIQNYETFSCW